MPPAEAMRGVPQRHRRSRRAPAIRLRCPSPPCGRRQARNARARSGNRAALPLRRATPAPGVRSVASREREIARRSARRVPRSSPLSRSARRRVALPAWPFARAFPTRGPSQPAAVSASLRRRRPTGARPSSRRRPRYRHPRRYRRRSAGWNSIRYRSPPRASSWPVVVRKQWPCTQSL